MVFWRSEFRHIGFRVVRTSPAAGDRVLWDGEGWYYSRPGIVESTSKYRRRARKVSCWRRQIGPHAISAKLRYFDELTRLLGWARSHIDHDGNFVEGVVVDYTLDWECNRSPRALLEHEMVSEYLGENWNRPHRVEREFPLPVTEITEPEPEQWPAWADEE